jgi:hypothetical protein
MKWWRLVMKFKELTTKDTTFGIFGFVYYVGKFAQMFLALRTRIPLGSIRATDGEGFLALLEMTKPPNRICAEGLKSA